MKILITGAGGYIGSVACYSLLLAGYEVVALDNFSTGYRKPLEFFGKKFGKKRFRYYKRDITSDLGIVFKNKRKIDAVVHFAAACSVDESVEKPEKYFRNNLCGTQNLISSMLRYKVNKIVFSSTSEVYGQSEYMPVDEMHSTLPINPYGQSKLMSENLIEWNGKLKDLNYIIFRYFNVCGASDDGIIGDSKKPSTLLVQNAVRGAMGIEKFYITCPKVDTPDGTPIRDYINVVDLCRAHIMALDYLSKKKKSGIFNLGTGTGYSVLEVINAVEKITNVKLGRTTGKKRKGEVSKKIADIRKVGRVLGWKPERTLEDSVLSLRKWYTKHPSGWIR